MHSSRPAFVFLGLDEDSLHDTGVGGGGEAQRALHYRSRFPVSSYAERYPASPCTFPALSGVSRMTGLTVSYQHVHSADFFAALFSS